LNKRKIFKRILNRLPRKTLK